MLCSQKYDLNWGLKQLREVWTKNFKTSEAEEEDAEMTGDGEGLGQPSADEDDFEKQMRLANESDKTAVRSSPSQAQVDQLEGFLKFWYMVRAPVCLFIIRGKVRGKENIYRWVSV